MRVTGAEVLAVTGARGFARVALLPSPVPGWQSVLLAAMPFSWFGRWASENAEVSAYYFASHRAYRAMAGAGEWLAAQGVRAEACRALRLKPLAEAAGFGVAGRNTLVRGARWGSCMAFQALLCDVPPEPSEPIASVPDCGACRLCAEACPTGAISAEGFSAEKCLRYYMMGVQPVPEPYRALMGRRLLGCEACQRVCPHNAPVEEAQPGEQALFDIGALLDGTPETLAAIARVIGRNEARKERLRAQACLAAGNSADARYLPRLRALAAYPHPVVSQHARWAVGRLEG